MPTDELIALLEAALTLRDLQAKLHQGHRYELQERGKAQREAEAVEHKINLALVQLKHPQTTP